MTLRQRKKREPCQVEVGDSADDFTQRDWDSSEYFHRSQSGLDDYIEDVDTRYVRSDPDVELTADQRAYGKDTAMGIFQSAGGDYK
jgi:hypothetical protein